MFRALDVALTVEQGTEVGTSADSPVVTAAGTRTAYNCDALAGTDAIDEDEANAHTYYNNVKSLPSGEAIDDTKLASESSYTAITTLQTGSFVFSLPTGAGNQAAAATPALDNILMVKFDIYLDGWDQYCFDAVRKQTFSLNMEFSATVHQ